MMANNWFSHIGVADVLAKVPNTPHKATYLSPTRKAIALRIDSMRVQISKNKITFSIGGYNRLFPPLRSRVVVVGVQMARKLNFYGPGDNVQHNHGETILVTIIGEGCAGSINRKQHT